MWFIHLRHELLGVVGGQQHDPRVARAGLARADDEDFAARRELVEHYRRIVAHARGQNVRLPRAGGQAHPSKLLEHGEHAVRAAECRTHACWGHVVPGRQETPVGGLRHRLGLRAGDCQRARTDDAQDFGGDVLFLVHALAVAPRDHLVLVHQSGQGFVGRSHRKPKGVGQVAQGKRPSGAYPAPDQLLQRVRDGGHLCCHPGRDGDAQAVAKQRGVKRLRDVLAPADAHPHHPAVQALLQRGQGDVGVVSERIHGDWPHHPQRVGELLAGFRAPQAAEFRVGFGDYVGVEKLPQLHGAQELGQQRRVEREGGGALFGERGVALVHEGAGVVEQQRGGERARLVRGHLRDADAARGQLAHDLLERGQVVDVLEALADRLQDDGERRVVARDVEELLRALALLPQRRALARVAARQEQGAGGALAEAGREQGGVAHLLGDDVGDLVGVKLEERPVRLLLPLRQA